MMEQAAPTAWLWMVSERSTGDEVGLVGLVTRDGKPEIGSIIVSRQQGKGYAYEALACVRDEGFQHLGLDGQFGCQLPINRRSIGLMQKLGFDQVPGRPDRIHWYLSRATWAQSLGSSAG